MESNQPSLTRPAFLSRALADSRDRDSWLTARSPGLGASDAAKWANEESAHLYLKAKLHSTFRGNSFTAHGNAREPAMLAAYRVEQNFTLFHAPDNRRHLATPDGIRVSGMTGAVVLVECKTTNKPIVNISPSYWRQVQWQQYVMEAEKTLFVWEEHQNFRPVGVEPESIWIARDDKEIARLIRIADRILAGMDEASEIERQFS